MKKVTGTIAELTNKITVNGKRITQPYLAALMKIGEGTFCRIVGKKVGKGRTAAIWEVDCSAKMEVAVKEG